MAKKSKTIQKEIKIILIAFIYLSMMLEENRKHNKGIISSRMKTIFYPLAKISTMYKHLFTDTTNIVNEISKKWESEKDVDFLLLSVTLVAVYYEAFTGKKRNFTPLKVNDILAIQEECINNIYHEIKDEREASVLIENTFSFSEFIVDYILEK